METKKREIEREKTNETQQHPQREGRLRKVWSTVTLFIPTIQGSSL